MTEKERAEGVPKGFPGGGVSPTSRTDTQEASPLAIVFAWRGAPTHHRDLRRSTNLNDWRPLFAIPHTTWTSTVTGPTADALTHLIPHHPNVYDARASITTWEDTAQLLDRCHLVVSVDTGLVHLAGAMDIPTFILVSKPGEWRWGHSRTTPWYPSMRIYRQVHPGDWSNVFTDLHVAVTAAVHQHQHRDRHAA